MSNDQPVNHAAQSRLKEGRSFQLPLTIPQRSHGPDAHGCMIEKLHPDKSLEPYRLRFHKELVAVGGHVEISDSVREVEPPC